MSRALDLVHEWPVPNVAAAVMFGGRIVDREGDGERTFAVASISKMITAWAILVAVEEGIVDLDDPVGPPSQPVRTLRHLLAHAGGYGFDSAGPIVSPERKRIYSNAGIELAAEHVSQAAAMPFREYLRLGVVEPLGMNGTELQGSPAHGLRSSVDDLVRFVDEVTIPHLISSATAADAVRPHFPSLGGIVPGVGRFDTCPWGLGFEVRGDKAPHWTGTRNSTSTFGHFGGAGTMMWIDPPVELSVIALTDRRFDEWSQDALRLWPELSDAVIAEFRSPATTETSGVR